MTIQLEQITVFNDIRDRLAAITPEHVEIAGKRLEKPQKGERVVGPICESTRVLWTLGVLLLAERQMEDAQANTLLDPAITEDHKQRAMIASELEDVVKEIMWCQCRMDTGFWEPESIGLREGWVLTTCKGPKQKLHGLLSMLGMPPVEPE